LNIPNILIEDQSGGYGNISENVLSQFINAKNLTIKDIEIEDFILKDIGELTKLEELNIVNCIDYDYYNRVGGRHSCLYEGNGCSEIFGYKLNWEYLKNLTKLNKLIINKNMDVPTWVIREYINNMKNLKKLEINGSKISVSKLSDCKDIAAYLNRKGQKNKSGVECVQNNQGQVTSLNITSINSQFTSNINMLTRLTSYPTINSLVMKDIEKVKEEDILKLTKNLKYLNELVFNGKTYDVKPEDINESNEISCPKAKALGYKCCSHCDLVYSDENGSWGIEKDDWCGIPEQCQSEYDKCWSSKKEGYPCCDHCRVEFEDESGKWGIMNNEWCGIPTNC